MRHYLGVAKDMGISDEEVGAVQACVMAVSGGRVMAQFREARLDKGTEAGEDRSS